jgi:hypothetical protein
VDRLVSKLQKWGEHWWDKHKTQIEGLWEFVSEIIPYYA